MRVSFSMRKQEREKEKAWDKAQDFARMELMKMRMVRFSVFGADLNSLPHLRSSFLTPKPSEPDVPEVTVPAMRQGMTRTRVTVLVAPHIAALAGPRPLALPQPEEEPQAPRAAEAGAAVPAVNSGRPGGSRA